MDGRSGQGMGGCILMEGWDGDLLLSLPLSEFWISNFQFLIPFSIYISHHHRLISTYY
jgi:hypothetical protein